MNVSVNLTRLDIVAIVAKTMFRLPANLYTLLALGCVMFAFTWSEIGFDSPRAVVIGIIFSAWAGVAGLVANGVIAVLFLVLTASERGGVLGVHHFSISPAGLSEVTAVNQSQHAWAGIRKVLKLRGYVVMSLPLFALHVFPRRAFASEEQFNTFFEQAKAWHGAAQRLQPGAIDVSPNP